MTTDKTIEEMNTDIADFMGYIHSTDPVWDKHEMENLKYHEDWNQLMAVGKKIRDYLQEQLRNRPPHTATNGDLLEVDISCAISCYDKAKAHKAIYDFIQWLNTTTTKQKD